MTITELSKLTGYSISTVSKALSDSSEISAPAKETILAAAKKTGYYNMALRRKKRIGVPKTVGVVTSGFAAGRTLDLLSDRLESAGITAVFCKTENAESLLADCFCVDALVITDGRSVPQCSIPVIRFDGDTDKIISALENEQNHSLPKKITSEKQIAEQKKQKDDIWLF